MKRIRIFYTLLMAITPTFAGISVNSASVDLTGVNSSQLISRLDQTIDEAFFAIASTAGPGIVNAAAFSSTMGIQRQSANLPKFQLEPLIGIIFPGAGKGDERLNALPIYAAALVGGYRFDENNAIQARGFYLPKFSFTVKDAQISFQPINFGVTFVKRVKSAGNEWYNAAIIMPLDAAYMHGSLAASFAGSKDNIAFDPSGTGKSARATINYSDQMNLNWDVFTFSTGFILVKPFLEILTARVGVLSSLALGGANLNNAATAQLNVTASNGTGTQEFKAGDVASLTITGAAVFKPIPVTNQFTFGLGLALGPATVNLDLSQNIQLNATAIMLQLGCWF